MNYEVYEAYGHTCTYRYRSIDLAQAINFSSTYLIKLKLLEIHVNVCDTNSINTSDEVSDGTRESISR